MSSPKPDRSPDRSRERGSVTVELIILLPALFTVMFLGLQAALFHHARAVAIAAAQEGAHAAATEHGRQADGITAATTFIADAGGTDVLTTSHATATRSATTVTVTVRGRSLSVIPGWSPQVVQSASLPVERLSAP